MRGNRRVGLVLVDPGGRRILGFRLLAVHRIDERRRPGECHEVGSIVGRAQKAVGAVAVVVVEHRCRRAGRCHLEAGRSVVVNEVGIAEQQRRANVEQRVAIGIVGLLIADKPVLTLVVEGVGRLQRDVDGAVVALGDEIEAVVEKLAEERHPTIERRRQADIRRTVQNRERAVSRDFETGVGHRRVERVDGGVPDTVGRSAGCCGCGIAGGEGGEISSSFRGDRRGENDCGTDRRGIDGADEEVSRDRLRGGGNGV